MLRIHSGAFVQHVVLITTLSLFVLGCEDAPQPLFDRAVTAVDKAAKNGAPQFADSEYQRATKLLHEGRLEMARQKGRLPFLRDYGVADSLLQAVLVAADSAQTEARDRETKLRRQAENEQAVLADELETWRAALNGSLMMLKGERIWAEARLAQTMSKRLLGEKHYQSAIETAIKGRGLVGELSRMLTEYENDQARKVQIWNSWISRTLEQSRKDGSAAVVVDKSAHKLYLVRAGKVVRSYSCELGYNSAGHKFFAGDGATPEGKYKVTAVKHRGSKYHKALLIDYPNADDKKRFKENKARGLISPRARIGALIEIHGDGGRNADWTDGCVALTNENMDHLMQYMQLGTPVTIVRRAENWP
jgi:hypothetical protein